MLIKNRSFITAIIVGIIISYIYFILYPKKIETIKVGILHSRTGELAISEAQIISMTLFAINEINSNGGLFGKQIEPILADGKSDPEIFAKEAKILIKEKKVEVIFGTWTSAARKAVKEVVEEYDKLLFYPAEYMGLEQSTNVIYMSLCGNKQAIPSVAWGLNNLGKKIFLVGSDYAYPVAENDLIKEFAPQIGVDIVGAELIPLGSENFDKVIEKIEQTKPDLIINSISGLSNILFFKELNLLAKKGIKINTISFSLSENEFNLIDLTNIANTYICTLYLQSIPSKRNFNFIKRFKAKFGYTKNLSASMISAYYGVNLWALAVKNAGSLDTKEVIPSLKKIIFNGPSEIFQVTQNGNIWSPVFIGKADKAKNFNIEWESKIPVEPVIMPSNLYLSKFNKKARTEEEWIKYLAEMPQRWGNKWQ